MPQKDRSQNEITGWKAAGEIDLVTLKGKVASADKWQDARCDKCGGKMGFDLGLHDGRTVCLCLECLTCYEIVPLFEGAPA